MELGGFSPSSRGRILLRENSRSSRLEIHFLWTLSLDSAAQAKNFLFYVNTEKDYERDYQAALPQGRTAADG